MPSERDTMTIMRNTNADADSLVYPACRHTVNRINEVLDGKLPVAALDGDEHGRACRECRERIAASKVLSSGLGALTEPASFPQRMTERLVAAVLADRLVEQRSRLRLRYSAIASSLAIAAGVVLAVWLGWFKSMMNATPDAPSVVREQPPTPAPPDSQHSLPAQPPVRLGEELARAEHALVNSSRPLTEPAEAAPQLLARLTDVLTRSAQPVPAFEAAGQSLLEIPEAARSGLEPVTSSAQKAFSRLIRDVGGVKPRSQEN